MTGLGSDGLGAVSEVGAAEELLARADATITRRHADPFGTEWGWVARAAPRFELEGRSLGSFLDWIETEGAWTVAFTPPELERSARSTVLHGSVERMSTTEALEAILPASGLEHRVDLKTGRVTVAAERPVTSSMSPSKNSNRILKSSVTGKARSK